MVFPSNAEGNTSKYLNLTVDQKILVPKGFQVEVMNGYVRLTTSAKV